ncbi:SPT3 Dosage dependent suppressor of Ty-induced promoter mutations-like protein [Rhizopus stolonifer]|uniref:SPT3 Dosage dependent suppressor of Ty-induced promoter mutations-like protein n=1 Tax=Rhizopus stolonifer TaxID=4846 RepID=A0A367KD73_RHIST|nr:SPT3 Dosage dependent suppressor of Ty-induced promoter mutations-like protein [Rhizopus stolonifer]
MITDDHKMPRSETRKRSRPLQDNTELSTPYQSPVLNTFSDPWQTMIPELYVDTPYVKQVLPSHGSLIGGTRVVLLGQGFRRGLQVMFGEHRAVLLGVSPTFLVCLAPPAFEPGSKPMSIQGQVSNAVFDYYDDGLQLLGELVQQILGIQPTDLVQALSQYPANLFQTNTMGHSLLHLACHLNMYPLAHWLLSQYPAMANLQDCNGMSPLHVALGSQSTAIIHALLSQGANVFLASCLGTPMELVISLFEKHYPHTKLMPALLDSYLPWLPKSFGK